MYLPEDRATAMLGGECYVRMRQFRVEFQDVWMRKIEVRLGFHWVIPIYRKFALEPEFKIDFGLKFIGERGRTDQRGETG